MERMLSWDRIRRNRLKLRDHFALNPNDLLPSLMHRNVITFIEDQQIRMKPYLPEQFEEFFDILFMKNPQECIPKFYEALVDINRESIRDFLQGVTGPSDDNRDAQF
ncbi:unnamed protein product [Darwinula stevensoni]|uniref:CARD domain-containing protein n=1 Tax=Darwinula stevensoni TaxID=69355 RepID=A0A7R8XEV7_9CRUS|nr:unnamed protein product [Darwinula stevensoni]CAG0890055.1 unnamed protein product [Darwinula stevensoni]